MALVHVDWESSGFYGFEWVERSHSFLFEPWRGCGPWRSGVLRCEDMLVSAS